ncbi:unnamed protein product [Microthlaspi erraticum]|uniref:ERCC4 domain-containing protein n=1 Tax=Microthlaspi erraticum TaxID=1685480 RepID=A0A6D2K9J8_9BRAS|nr:unnamed protein product [Microthlaspi erraticum]
MSDPILISDEEDEVTPPSKRARKNPSPTILKLGTNSTPPGSAFTPLFVDETPLSDDVTVVKSHFGPGAGGSSHRENKFSGKQVIIPLDLDSEDSPRPGTSKKYEPIHVDSTEQPCRLESGSSDADSDDDTNWMHKASFRSSLPNDAIEVDSDQEKEEVLSLGERGRQKQPGSSKNTPKKQQMSKDEKIRVAEEKKLQKEQEKLKKAALKAEEAQQRKLDKERQKLENVKLALKSIVAEIDVQLVEGSIGAPLISMFSEKGITYRVTSNPIKRSIVWTMTLPEEIAQTLPLGGKIPYVLLVYEAEDFCNLVANERILENISRVRDQYPSYKVCYLTIKLLSYVNKREKEEYKNLGQSNGWRRPPIDEVLAKVTTHYVGVHSRHCVDEAEVAEHVFGLTSSLASCQTRKKTSWLSVNAAGAVPASMDPVDKQLFKKSPWLKALVAIPKVQPRYAVAVSKKYPSMKSLLKVYMDPNKTEHEKEFLLKDLKLEGLMGDEKKFRKSRFNEDI